MRDEFLRKVCNIIADYREFSDIGGYFADLRPGDNYDRDDYLLDFGLDGSHNFVVMGDLGVTWEPSRAYTTPCYGQIRLTTPIQVAAILMKFTDLARDGLVPSHSEDSAYQPLFDGDLSFKPKIVFDDERKITLAVK